MQITSLFVELWPPGDQLPFNEWQRARSLPERVWPCAKRWIGGQSRRCDGRSASMLYRRPPVTTKACHDVILSDLSLSVAICRSHRHSTHLILSAWPSARPASPISAPGGGTVGIAVVSPCVPDAIRGFAPEHAPGHSSP
jgi:hypothetical protein